MKITLRQLQAFTAVASRGSFTRASERMHIAQSAISVLVRELEKELGVRLFDRTTRRVELTDAGREFNVNAEKLIADLKHAVRNAHELAQRKRGRLVVAAPPLLAQVLMPQAIADFARDFPGVRVVLRDVQTDQIVAKVMSAEVDIGIGTFDTEEKGLVRTRLVCDTLMLYCASRHPLASHRRPKWRDLKGMPLVAVARENGIRALVDYAYKAAGLASEPAYEVVQVATALALVEAGLGVTVLPACATAASASRDIVVRPLCSPNISREISVVARRDRSLPLAAGEFLKRLRAQANARSLKAR